MMHFSELEGWLLRMGWQPESHNAGSHRHWTHPRFPGQHLTYAQTGQALRPDVVIGIYQRLITFQAVQGDTAHGPT